MQRHPALALAIPLVAGLIAAITLPAQAAAETTRSDTAVAARSSASAARQLLDSAVTFLKDNRPERAFAAFNNQKGGFYRDDLYVFVVGIDDGIMHAHGGAVEGIVGADVRDLRDATGKPVVRAMLDIAAASGEGKLEYVWLNRVTNRVENKTTQIRRVGNYLVGVGHYTK